MLKSTLITLTTVALVSACSGRETDPRKSGFIQSLLNQTDGTNDQRLDEKRVRNAEQAEVNAATAESTRQLDAEQSRLERRVRSTRAKISSLEKRISSAKQGLNTTDSKYVKLTLAEEDLAREKARLESAAAAGDEGAVLVQLRKVGLIEEELAL